MNMFGFEVKTIIFLKNPVLIVYILYCILFS